MWNILLYIKLNYVNMKPIINNCKSSVKITNYTFYLNSLSGSVHESSEITLRFQYMINICWYKPKATTDMKLKVGWCVDSFAVIVCTYLFRLVMDLETSYQFFLKIWFLEKLEWWRLEMKFPSKNISSCLEVNDHVMSQV